MRMEKKELNAIFKRELMWAMRGNGFFTKRFLTEKYKGNPKALETIEKYIH
jgi:hypothetical protein